MTKYVVDRRPHRPHQSLHLGTHGFVDSRPVGLGRRWMKLARLGGQGAHAYARSTSGRCKRHSAFWESEAKQDEGAPEASTPLCRESGRRGRWKTVTAVNPFSSGSDT